MGGSSGSIRYGAEYAAHNGGWLLLWVGDPLQRDSQTRNGNGQNQKPRPFGVCSGSEGEKSNEDIVRFQAMVGGRRAALSRLTGKCFVYDESGCPCVLFERDKGGKPHKQRIRLEDVEAVKAYFDAVGPDELLFPKLDKDLDLHGIRAENARCNYQRSCCI